VTGVQTCALPISDGTGHGLAASLGVMPVVQPFYAMTQKGFGLSTIVREVNRKVREWLPVGRFVAATLVSIDPRDGQLLVWNGGTPPVVLLDADGRELQRFHSRNLPLGILDDASLDDTLERYSLPVDAHVIACSDGVVEAQSDTGEDFGMDRLIQAAASAPRERRMAAMNAALHEHLKGASAHDDLSLLIVDCANLHATGRDADARDSRDRQDVVPNWSFRTELTCDDLRSTDVIARFTGTMERMGLPERHRTNLFVVLSELFSNALDYGLLLIDPALRTQAGDGMDRHLALRSKRLRLLSEGAICVELDVDARTSRCARVRVFDSGDGFDWRKELARDDAAQARRGLQLVRALCASVRFSERGNEVTAIYELQ